MPKEEMSREQLLIVIADLRQKIESLEQTGPAPRFAENFYKTLANSSQAGVYIMQDRKFQFVNPHIQDYAGYSEAEMLGMNPVSIIHPVDRAQARKNAVRMLKGQRFSPYEFRIITGDGRIKWILESVTAISYNDRPAVLGNSMNVTEQKEARNRLEELEALESSILDAIPHAVIGLHNREFIFANNAVRSVFGWRPEELIGKGVRLLYRSDEDSETIAAKFYATLETQRTFAMEFPCRRKDGEDILCMVRASRIGESLRERRIVVTYEDITERRRAEEELERSREELRNLSSHLQSVREQERTQIAREIHDELGQSLTALKMDLTWMGKRLKDNEPLLEKTRSMGKLIDGTIEMVHRISADLRPGLLDDFGLVAALEWFAKDFQKRSGIVCRARLEVDDLALDKEMSTTIFRIFQETLTNVARHAEARRVDVRLAASGGRLILEVSDDGRGITKKQMNDPRSFGIIGMRERAHSWGGEVLITGNRDRGTTVRLTIPLGDEEAGA